MACAAASRAARDSFGLQREPGSALRKSGVEPGFRSSVTRFRRFVARMERSEIRERHRRLHRRSRIALRSIRATKKEENEGSGTPANADPYPPHLAMRLAPCSALICRRSTAALTQGSIPSQRLSFRPGFLGRGLNGRYPPSPVPVQGSTSRPGRNAGRHDAQAARERTAKPPAGTTLAPMTRCASAPRPSRSEDYAVTATETYVNRKVT